MWGKLRWFFCVFARAGPTIIIMQTSTSRSKSDPVVAGLRGQGALGSRTRWLLALGLALGSLQTGGCASPLAKARSDNQQLTRTVDELRLEKRDKDRRLRDLEKQMAMLREPRGTQADRAGGQARVASRNAADSPTTGLLAAEPMPELKVEVMAPIGDSDLGEPGRAEQGRGEIERVVGTDDNGSEIVYMEEALRSGPEPVVVMPAASRTRRALGLAPDERPRPRDRSDARSDRTARVRAPLRPMPSAQRAPERSESSVAKYREAVALLKRGEHANAVAMLRDFLQANPSHDYADNAQYWLGEAFYDQKDYIHAVSEFRTTVEKYPQGNKVPDAMLKVGYCYYAMGQGDKGETVLAELVRLYPKTEPAELAAKRLETK